MNIKWMFKNIWMIIKQHSSKMFTESCVEVKELFNNLIEAFFNVLRVVTYVLGIVILPLSSIVLFTVAYFKDRKGKNSIIANIKDNPYLASGRRIEIARYRYKAFPNSHYKEIYDAFQEAYIKDNGKKYEG